jgi:hypothetical protein
MKNGTHTFKMTNLTSTSNVWFAASFIRIVIVLCSFVCERGSHSSPTYTDVDYHVFSDAGDLLLKGKSPYDRATYRYSPVFALIASLNHIIHPTAAKLVFGMFDILVAVLMYRIYDCSSSDTSHRRVEITSPNKSIKWLWLLNPIVINISTRGSSDSIPCFFVLVSLYCCMKAIKGRDLCLNMKATPTPTKQVPWTVSQRHVLVYLIVGGFCQGIAVHIKLYPIIYLFGNIVALRSQRNDQVESSTFPSIVWSLFTIEVSLLLLPYIHNITPLLFLSLSSHLCVSVYICVFLYLFLRMSEQGMYLDGCLCHRACKFHCSGLHVLWR